MIPLSDIDRRPLRLPVITISIVGLNIIVFLFELMMGKSFIIRWSFIPAEIAAGKHFTTILTSLFLHGGFMHIIGNMIYLWAFGPEMEDAMGKYPYLFFYLAGGILASFAQVAINPASTIPNLGASGAISAVMGAFLVKFPHDRIRTIIFLGWFVTISFVPSIVLIGFWFVLQLLSGFGSFVQHQMGGIAYMAHIGGFVFGMVFGYLFIIFQRHFQNK
ncbi:MAG: rhomboid family intramembrane serine protease [bacterium]